MGSLRASTNTYSNLLSLTFLAFLSAKTTPSFGVHGKTTKKPPTTLPDDLPPFFDPFGDHDTTPNIPSIKKKLPTTIPDDVPAFFDPFGDHDTMPKKPPTPKKPRTSLPDDVPPFDDSFGDHDAEEPTMSTRPRPKKKKPRSTTPMTPPKKRRLRMRTEHPPLDDYVMDDEETTLFTIPELTTTPVARGKDGFPIRSRYFSASEIKRRLKDFKIIPDVIDESQSPKHPCELMYSKMEPKEKGTHAVFGTKLETAIVRYEPFYVEWPTKFDEKYTLLLISPDYPTVKNPTEKEYLHWMVINIPESYVTSGTQLAEYVGTIPQPHTGYHRYVVLIFKQKDEIRVHRLHSRGDDPSRPHFNTRKFIEQYKLGAPYAINFFGSKWTNDSEYWTEGPEMTSPTTTDTPYPHHTFTWFPKTTSNVSTTEEKEWWED